MMMGRGEVSKDAELLVLRHECGRSRNYMIADTLRPGLADMKLSADRRNAIRRQKTGEYRDRLLLKRV
jgi:hypothetical protein